MASDLLTPADSLLAICFIICILVIGYIYAVRSRLADEKEQEHVRSRAQEKEEDARALEDTLLQNTQGLILRFHAVADQMALDDPSRRPLEDALLRAEQVIAEEAERVLALSQPDHDPSDLVKLFAAAGRDILGSRTLRFRSVSEGFPRSLNAFARSEILAFGREALLNAGHDSQARKIEVQIVYTDEHLILRIRDDGLGMGARRIDSSARSQQAGLRRMNACATSLGAKMEVWSRDGAGTEVGLVIPAGTAYRAGPRPVER